MKKVIDFLNLGKVFYKDSYFSRICRLIVRRICYEKADEAKHIDAYYNYRWTKNNFIYLKFVSNFGIYKLNHIVLIK